MKKNCIFLAVLLCLGCVFGLQASDRNKNASIRIAVINMDNIFNAYHKTKIEEAKLQKQAEIYQEYAQQLAESLKKLRTEFITLRDASQNAALSASERENRRLNAAEKYNQMIAKERELKEYSSTKQAKLREEQEKMRDMILKDIRNVVTGKCLAEGIHLVLDRSSRTPGDIPSVIYASRHLDITADVIKTLNMGLKAPAKTPSSKK